jgi:hypothetical protein
MAEFSWLNVVPTLVGGAISIVTTFAVLTINQRLDRQKKARESNAKNAFHAYAGLQKFLKTAQAIISLDNHLTREFKEAQTDRIENDDPGNLVRPILHSPIPIIDLSVEEIFFLAKSGHANLILEMDELQQRARNNYAIVAMFNEAKAEYSRFLETKTHAIAGISSTSASYGLEGDDALTAIQKVANLNTLLGALIPALDEDIPRVKRVVASFVELAVKEFGADFPKTKVEWKGANHANP